MSFFTQGLILVGAAIAVAFIIYWFLNVVIN